MILFNGWKSLLAIPLLVLVFFVIGVPTMSPGIGAIAAGAAVGGLGFYLNRERPYEDPATGQTLYRKERNGFFWIPLQMWGVIVIVLGVVYLLMART
jgi:hypothetical protein